MGQWRAAGQRRTDLGYETALAGKMHWNEPPELFDLEIDRDEFVDLAARPEYAATHEELTASALHDWDPVEIDRRVRESQR